MSQGFCPISALLYYMTDLANDGFVEYEVLFHELLVMKEFWHFKFLVVHISPCILSCIATASQKAKLQQRNVTSTCGGSSEALRC